MAKIVLVGREYGTISSGSRAGMRFLRARYKELATTNQLTATRNFFTPFMISRYEKMNLNEPIPNLTGVIRRVWIEPIHIKGGIIFFKGFIKFADETEAEARERNHINPLPKQREEQVSADFDRYVARLNARYDDDCGLGSYDYQTWLKDEFGDDQDTAYWNMD